MGWSRATWDAEGWRTESACRDADPDLFFPVGTTGDALAQIAVAKEVCALCPVAEECLIFAVTTNQEYGIWGGLDEEERRDVRRRWRKASREVKVRSAQAPASAAAPGANPPAGASPMAAAG